MSAWRETAERVAAAMGANVLIGVRPKGTWFAHCNGVEVDAAGPAECVRDLASRLRSDAEQRERIAEASARAAGRQLSVLYDVLAPANLSKMTAFPLVTAPRAPDFGMGGDTETQP